MTGPVVVVTGFGRCGSTMLMTMLRAGGIPFAPGAHPRTTEHPGLAAGLAAAQPGHVVKLLDPTQPEWILPLAASGWVFLWLDRDLVQQARSWAKLCTGFGIGQPTRLQQDELRRQWNADRLVVLAELPGRVHRLRFEDIITRPRDGALQLARALPEYDLDLDAMAAVVHHRTPACRPDLEVEFSLTRRGPHGPPPLLPDRRRGRGTHAMPWYRPHNCPNRPQEGP